MIRVWKEVDSEKARWDCDSRARKLGTLVGFEIGCASHEGGRYMKHTVISCARMTAHFGILWSCLPDSRVKLEIANNALTWKSLWEDLVEVHAKPGSCLALGAKRQSALYSG